MFKNTIAISLVAVFLAFAGCSSMKYESAGTPAQMPEYSLGYLKVNYEKPIADVYKATLAAYKDLGIAVTQGKADSLTGIVAGTLADGTTATTDLKAVTEKETAVSIRVGTMGNRDFSYRINERIKKHL